MAGLSATIQVGSVAAEFLLAQAGTPSSRNSVCTRCVCVWERRELQHVRRAVGRSVVRATPSSSSGKDSGSSSSSSTPYTSILCKSCDGNGAVLCSQCEGSGLNSQDHFGGRFKAGETCWLCRGKRQMLCGNCNGAGFMGGFMNTQDE